MRTLTAAAVADLTAAPIVADVSELDRPAWLQLRRQGLGGSDAAAVLGVSKWTSPLGLWMEKTGRLPADEDGSTLAQRRGQFKEPFILAEATVTDPDLTIARAPYMLRHPDHGVLLANVDGIGSHRMRRGVGGVEAKDVHPFAVQDWADGVPAYYEAQVHHYLAVTGLPWWVVAADTGADEIQLYFIDADPDFQAKLVEAEVAWWDRHVVGDEEPLADASAACTEVLALIEERAGLVRQLDPDELAQVDALLLQLAHDRAVRKDAEAGEDLGKNRLRQLLGEATELVGPDGEKLATWRRAKDKTVVDQEAALARAALSLGVPQLDLLAPHTTTAPGNRSLRVDAGLKRAAALAADTTTDQKAA